MLPRPNTFDLDDLSDFERMYRDHYAYVWAVLRRLGVEAVADAHQEVFITAYRRRDTFDPARPVRHWLVGIARRVAFRARRGQQRHHRRRSALAWFHATSEPSPVLEGRVEAREFLARFVAHLDEPHREVFTLGELEGHTGPEIAEALDIGVEAAYGRLRTVRRRFKRALLAVESGPPPEPAKVRRSFALLLGRLDAGPISSIGPVLASKAPAVAALGATTAGLVIMLGSTPTPPPAASEPTIERSTARADPNRSSRPAPPAVTPAPAPPATAPPATAPPPSAPAAPSQARSRVLPAAVAPPDPVPPPPSLTEQTRRLQSARAQLDRARPGDALRTLESHARDFPDSPLREARDAFRVEVLCALGRTAQARGEAQVALRRNPDSAVARHATTLCARD